jgi:hypothetical protein
MQLSVKPPTFTPAPPAPCTSGHSTLAAHAVRPYRVAPGPRGASVRRAIHPQHRVVTLAPLDKGIVPEPALPGGDVQGTLL